MAPAALADVLAVAGFAVVAVTVLVAAAAAAAGRALMTWALWDPSWPDLEKW